MVNSLVKLPPIKVGTGVNGALSWEGVGAPGPATGKLPQGLALPREASWPDRQLCGRPLRRNNPLWLFQPSDVPVRAMRQGPSVRRVTDILNSIAWCWSKNLANPKDKERYLELKEKYYREFLIKVLKSNGVDKI